MKYNWFPWRYIVKSMARRHGFLDPLHLLAQLRRFAQPSEVGEPIELLRAGMLFHARGLMNTRAIQHNLDWIWPYWVQRQFDPADESFIPRAFSFSHINLTHRNWTAVGQPDCPVLSLVDPRGLVTPFYDGWSYDAWIVGEDGSALIPAHLVDSEQVLDFSEDLLKVVTRSSADGLFLESETALLWRDNEPVCKTLLRARTEKEGAWLTVSIRPYNPEGVNFIYDLSLQEDRCGGKINKKHLFRFDQSANRSLLSHYQRGDVFNYLFEEEKGRSIHCDVGMATAALLFELSPAQGREIAVEVPLASDIDLEMAPRSGEYGASWWKVLENTAALRAPDEKVQFLFDAAVRTMVLHSPRDVFPGPYTYKRFWFRDAAFMIHALLVLGMADRAERALDQFAPRQSKRSGYFISQEGEWDANGEALWIYHRFCQLTGRKPKPEWLKAIVPGARWIGKKRLKRVAGTLHDGLLPAGFSAEHLGPNDYYYWDDFWGVAGLHAAADLIHAEGERRLANEFRAEAKDLMKAVEASILATGSCARYGSIPASPYRRMDAGAIGSIVVDYPLQLWKAGDSRVLKTAHFLIENCFFKGGFFQDMVHSGINAYLTLHLAQVLLRANDLGAYTLIRAVADLASPTGQWPEAIHPRTEGGCMGDGQHAWAAAEWVLAIRNLFVREEKDRLILASGIPDSWLQTGKPLLFGPAPTPWGTLLIEILPHHGTNQITIEWVPAWRKDPPLIEIHLPGYPVVRPAKDAKRAVVKK